jgi:hypothetical protein
MHGLNQPDRLALAHPVAPFSRSLGE